MKKASLSEGLQGLPGRPSRQWRSPSRSLPLRQGAVEAMKAAGVYDTVTAEARLRENILPDRPVALSAADDRLPQQVGSRDSGFSSLHEAGGRVLGGDRSFPVLAHRAGNGSPESRGPPTRTPQVFHLPLLRSGRRRFFMSSGIPRTKYGFESLFPLAAPRGDEPSSFSFRRPSRRRISSPSRGPAGSRSSKRW